MNGHRPGVSLLSLAVLGLLVGLPRPADAQQVDTRLSIEFNRRYQELRTGSPISIDWTLTWNGEGLPRGYLEIHVLQEQIELGMLRTAGERVLTDSGTRFRTLLPTFKSDAFYAPLDILAYFVSDKGVFDLGERSLRIAGPLRRSFIVAFCDAWQRTSSPEEVAFTASLDFSTLLRARSRDDPYSQVLATYPARVFPNDLPSDPLWLCEYNMVVLLPDGFRDLRRDQLEALARWIDAGGSLCVFFEGTLTAVHTDFLNRLAGSPDSNPLVSLDEKGRVRIATTTAKRIRKGLGHVVITAGDPLKEAFIKSDGWKSAVGFLWKRHANFRPAPAPGPGPGQGNASDPSVSDPFAPPGNVIESEAGPGGRPIRVLPSPNVFPPTTQTSPERAVKWRISSLGSLLGRLTPDDFEVVPLWILGLMLVGYVIVIGPGDYLLLGLFRARKLTWVFFPLVTLGFTLLIVWTSHHYMGTSGGGRAVVFRDLGDGSEVVRESRFVLLLKGSHTTVETPVKRALFTPINHHKFLSEANAYYEDPFARANADPGKPTEYIGTIPGEFNAVQDLPQWSPQLNRTFAIAPQVSMPSFDWDAVHPEELSRQQNPPALIAAIHEAFGVRATVLLFHGPGPPRTIVSSDHLFPESESWATQEDIYRPAMNQRLGPQPETSRGFLYDTCVRPRIGIFQVVSQISPHGGDNFEDLALLDPSDLDQWLLVIGVPERGQLVLYRKLYTRPPTTTSR